MTFVKGISGNPEGGNNELTRRNKILRDRLSGEAEVLLKKLMHHVHSEDASISLAATRDALDRLYGKAMASVEMSGPDGGPLSVMSSTPITVEAFALRFAPVVEDNLLVED